MYKFHSFASLLKCVELTIISRILIGSGVLEKQCIFPSPCLNRISEWHSSLEIARAYGYQSYGKYQLTWLIMEKIRCDTSYCFAVHNKWFYTAVKWLDLGLIG